MIREREEEISGHTPPSFDRISYFFGENNQRQREWEKEREKERKEWKKIFETCTVIASFFPVKMVVAVITFLSPFHDRNKRFSRVHYFLFFLLSHSFRADETSFLFRKNTRGACNFEKRKKARLKEKGLRWIFRDRSELHLNEKKILSRSPQKIFRTGSVSVALRAYKHCKVKTQAGRERTFISSFSGPLSRERRHKKCNFCLCKKGKNFMHCTSEL